MKTAYPILHVLVLAGAFLLAACSENTSPIQPVGEKSVKQTPEQIFAVTLKAAEHGDAAAQSELGMMYYTGEGVSKDKLKAVEWVRKAAEQGNANAQYLLGDMYREGNGGVSKDAVKAAEWIRKSAEQGNGLAMGRLAVMYGTGEGVPKDYTKTLEWAQKGAAQGNERAQGVLGWLYSNGEGVPKDAAKAVKWFHKAAAQGNKASQHNLGVSYANGEGVPVDKVLAYAWYNLAAAQGDDDAKNERNLVEQQLSPQELQEAARLSSNWKNGQIMTREISSTVAGSATSGGTLAKHSTGTVFVVSKSGHAITNQHVVNGCTELRVEGRDGIAKLVTNDKVNDLALVQIPGTIKAAAAIAKEPKMLRQGDEIVVFGYPLNFVLSSGGNLTPGVVSALTGLGNNTNQIQITAPIQPGSSGSPVLNKKGEVTGVVSMKLSDREMAKATGSVGQNINFAVGGQTLKTFLDTHKVDYRTGSFMSFDKSTADLADEARNWTLVVECWK